jgi:type II secretory pathway pseudopilin PulG
MEMMIVIAILGLFAGVIGISANKMMVDQRFRNEVSFIVDQLRLAQDLMLIMKTDVTVKFVAPKDAKGITISLDTETKLPEAVQREIKRKKNVLKTIRGVFFKDELSGSYSSGELGLKFLSRGAVMSKGVMRVATTDEQNPPDNALQSYICLAGYPRPISSYDTQEAAENECLDALDNAYYKQLTRDTFALLPEKLKKTSEAPSQLPTKGDKGNVESSKQPQPDRPERPSPPQPKRD